VPKTPTTPKLPVPIPAPLPTPSSLLQVPSLGGLAAGPSADLLSLLLGGLS